MVFQLECCQPGIFTDCLVLGPGSDPVPPPLPNQNGVLAWQTIGGVVGPLPTGAPVPITGWDFGQSSFGVTTSAAAGTMTIRHRGDYLVIVSLAIDPAAGFVATTVDITVNGALAATVGTGQQLAGVTLFRIHGSIVLPGLLGGDVLQLRFTQPAAGAPVTYFPGTWAIFAIAQDP